VLLSPPTRGSAASANDIGRQPPSGRRPVLCCARPSGVHRAPSRCVHARIGPPAPGVGEQLDQILRRSAIPVIAAAPLGCQPGRASSPVGARFRVRGQGAVSAARQDHGEIDVGHADRLRRVAAGRCDGAAGGRGQGRLLNRQNRLGARIVGAWQTCTSAFFCVQVLVSAVSLVTRLPSGGRLPRLTHETASLGIVADCHMLCHHLAPLAERSVRRGRVLPRADVPVGCPSHRRRARGNR
jgi:hypothetical protein